MRRSGLKAKARQIADELIQAYRDCPDPEFVYAICETCGHKIDFLIWKAIVLPELQKGLADNPRAIRGMIETIQNLYSSKSDWESLEYITEEQLAIRLLQICPNDQWTRQRRTEQLRRWLSYTIHEWPSGVLYGADGATLEQCDEILDAVEELRGLDDARLSNDLCDEVKEKTIEYRSRLANRTLQRTPLRGGAEL